MQQGFRRALGTSPLEPVERGAHDAPHVARVIRVLHEDRHGLAETPDGAHVRFHELSVVGGLAILAEGDEVALSQMQEQDGSIGWIVRRTGRHRGR